MRPGLRGLQRDRCFYCGERQQRSAGRRPEVDHVIPWARYPNNAIENLMVANERCKGRKRNFLAAPEHQGRWRERFGRNPLTALELEHVAKAADWELAPGRSASVTRAIYLRLPADAQLWNRGQEFVEDEPQEL